VTGSPPAPAAPAPLGFRPSARRGAARTGERPLVDARRLAEALPDLLVEATRVAATVAAGWHGRRRAGSGETFWQYRPHSPGEPVQAIDWRRSARGDDLHVREREWEAAHAVHLVLDLSASMDWRSDLAPVTKATRALVVALALADLLGRAGERVGMPGLLPARADRRSAERLAEALARADRDPFARPAAAVGAHCEVVVIGDFLDDPAAIEARLGGFAAQGARLHALRIVDPAEPSLPFAGNVDFRDPETGTRFEGRRAEALRDRWADRWAAHGEALARLAARHRWTFSTHQTDRPATEALLALHAGLGGRHAVHGRERGR
jgi:uncharacterized protein (DUF58 family)